MIQSIYKIAAPHSCNSAHVLVYGDPENCWYEWRFIDDDGRVIKDTGEEGSQYVKGRQYGDAEVALLHALNFAAAHYETA